MSEIVVPYHNSVLENIHVYDIAEAVKASKYPFAVDTSAVDSEITKTTVNLAHCPIGRGDDNFLCGILCAFDLTFTTKAWTEFQRYHHAEIVSSQSTMHCIKRFDIERQCNGYVDKRTLAVLGEKIAAYNAAQTEENFLDLIYNIPSGFRLTARVTTNYRQLKTMYVQRRNHRLTPDWGEFCNGIEELPMSYLITGKEKMHGN